LLPTHQRDVLSLSFPFALERRAVARSLQGNGLLNHAVPGPTAHKDLIAWPWPVLDPAYTIQHAVLLITFHILVARIARVDELEMKRL
jgi:hypothetical protein